jgi:hypothetical protein
MAVAEISGLEVDLVDGDVAAVATGLVSFVLGNCFDDQLEMIKFKKICFNFGFIDEVKDF